MEHSGEQLKQANRTLVRSMRWLIVVGITAATILIFTIVFLPPKDLHPAYRILRLFTLALIGGTTGFSYGRLSTRLEYNEDLLASMKSGHVRTQWL